MRCVTHVFGRVSQSRDGTLAMKFIFKFTLLLIFALTQFKWAHSYHVPAHSASRPGGAAGHTFLVERRCILNIALPALITFQNPFPCIATENDTANLFKRETPGFSYIFTPPPNFHVSNKPLKTHLDEVNFEGDLKGYQYGITVDPVRLQTLRQFGSPEEVAAKIVTSEVNRDGVFEVTLARDPLEDEVGAYIVEYISDGKRGKKRFVTRTIVNDGKLYVLTVQSKEEDFSDQRRHEVYNAIHTFKVVKGP